MVESNVLKRVLLKASEIGSTLFRNNTGLGWVGKVIRPSKPTMMLVTPVDVLVKNARPLHAGLCEGSSDTIGWMTVTITPPMIGRKIAVFVALEVKDTGGRPSPEQLNFVERARAGGAIAGIVYSAEEAAELLNTSIGASS